MMQPENAGSFAFCVPCHNEAANIGTLLKILASVSFRSRRPDKIVVVSDASTDGTDDIVAEMAHHSPIPIDPIPRSVRLGKCSAINRGLQELQNVAIVVLVSGDVVPAADCLVKLLAAFDDPAVGVAGGRPVPAGPAALWSVRVARAHWAVHHFIAEAHPKTTEVTAFRNVGVRLDETSLVDEAELEYAMTSRGFTVAYIPDALIQTPAPLTLRDYLRQRIRVTLGHARLRRRSGFAISSLSIATRLKATWRVLRDGPDDLPAMALGIVLETIIYATAILRGLAKPTGSGVWARIESTKRPLGEPSAGKDGARFSSMKLSLIIPVFNGGAAFEKCLAALETARRHCAGLGDTELIVVDDGSTDHSASLARAAGAHVISTPPPGRHGPALARNLGARAATGDIGFFVDADVALHPTTLRRALEAFHADPELDACFGSYDDAPSESNFLSQYKNLFHHYVHQHGQVEASTFWAGCGAIRLAAFHAVGGFDDQTYQRPSVEDIDLGYRLRRRGMASGRRGILLIKEMQCVHLKRWTLRNLLRADIFERGVPWTVLLWRESHAWRLADLGFASEPRILDLNLQRSSRISVALAILLALSLVALPFAPLEWPLSLACAVILLILNWKLYRFFWEKRGFRFMLGVIAWNWFYYLYNGLSFSLGTLRYFVYGAPPIAADGRPDASGQQSRS